MKKKIILLLIILVAIIGINVDAKEVTLDQTTDELLNLDDILVNSDSWSHNIDVYSKKTNNYQVVRLEGNARCTVKDFIKNIISDDELINGNSVRLLINYIDSSYRYSILSYNDNIEMYYDRDVSIGQKIPKGTLMYGNIIFNSEIKSIFYTDQDYYIKSNYGWNYNQYYEIEPLNTGFNLNCLNRDNNNHNCELYYNYSGISSDMNNDCNGQNNCNGIFMENIYYIEMKYKVKLNNLKGIVKIGNEKLSLEEEKEYTVRINKDSMTDEGKLLAGSFDTQTVDTNNSSNITIVPTSIIVYTTTGEYELPIENIESKCDYKIKEPEKGLINPITTSSKRIIIVISLTVLSMLAIFVKKEYITKL